METRRAGPDLLLVALAGGFVIAAQALLFRAFFAVFEGNELGIAVFFGSWLLWVAAGASLARPSWPCCRRLAAGFAPLPLLLPPAFLLQAWLIHSGRTLAGVAGTEIFPLHLAIPAGLLANAPVPFLSGALFPLACAWLRRHGGLAVGRAHACDALGSCMGGMAATGLLLLRLPAETAFLIISLVLAAAVLACVSGGRAKVGAGIFVLALAAAVAAKAGHHWQRTRNLAVWSRLLPPAGFAGSFVTARADYQFGGYGDMSCVTSGNAVVETFPDPERAAELAAIHLAQKPGARDFLVIGEGMLALCHRLAALPGTASVTWLTRDPEYAKALFAALPPEIGAAGKLVVPGIDPRLFVSTAGTRFDCAIISLPDPSSLAMNRYYSREWFAILAGVLRPGGLVSVRLTAADNFLGQEMSRLGATLAETMRLSFPHQVLKPGDESWLIAAAEPDAGLTGDAALLAGRLAAMPGGAELYPPAGMFSLYNLRRQEFQWRHYRDFPASPGSGIQANTDARPRALLHSLRLFCQQAGAPAFLSRGIAGISSLGMPLLLAAAGVYMLLRFARLAAAGTCPPDASTASKSGCLDAWDCRFLVCTAGAVAMGLNMLLLFRFQAVHGSLFLHAGTVTALFMLGLTISSFLATRRLEGQGRGRGTAFAAAALATQLAVAMLLALPPAAAASFPVFLLLFFLAGAASGAQVPAVAEILRGGGMDEQHAGTLVTGADHLGGALGGILAGLLLLPVLGVSATIGLLCLLLLANSAALAARVPLARRLACRLWPPPGPDEPAPDRFDTMLRVGGGVILALALAMLLARPPADTLPAPPPTAEAAPSAVAGQQVASATEPGLGAMLEPAGGAPWQTGSFKDPDGNSRACHFRQRQEGGLEFVFSSRGLTPGIRGFGGPLVLGLRLDQDGTLLGLRLLQHAETELYLRRTEDWQRSLTGRPAASLATMDAVSGATATSDAIRLTAAAAAVAFMTELSQSAMLGDHLVAPASSSSPHARIRPPVLAKAKTGTPWRGWAPVCLLAVLAVLALGLRRRPSHRGRLLFLTLVLAVAGLLLNLQYSSEQVRALLAGQSWQALFSSPWMFPALLVPVLVLLAGNIYCGWLCPFGALQELAAWLRPRFLAAAQPTPRAWRLARTFKYLLLGALVVAWASGSATQSMRLDPLPDFFARPPGTAALAVGGIMLLLTMAYPRFWCRCLCPAGAFLSLLNRLRLLRPLVPAVSAKACSFGLWRTTDLDCLCCDRCRMLSPAEAGVLRQAAAARETGRLGREAVFLALALAAVLALWFARPGDGRPSTAAATAQPALTTPNLPQAAGRQVDVDKFRRLIETGQLSGREALHYRKLKPVPATPTDSR